MKVNICSHCPLLIILALPRPSWLPWFLRPPLVPSLLTVAPRPLASPMTSLSSCSSSSPVVATTLTSGAWWNSALLFIKHSAVHMSILTASLTCLTRQLENLPHIFIENSAFSPLCSSRQCFHRALFSSSNLRAERCSAPLVNPFRPVSPS